MRYSIIAALWLLLSGSWACAAEGVCARVRIEIAQELTFERQAFEARMTIANGLPSTLRNIRASIYFQKEDGTIVTVSYLKPDGGTGTIGQDEVGFFYRSNDADHPLDGSGFMTRDSIPTATEAQPSETLTWLIIPAPGASGTVPQGKLYYVGAELRYTVGENGEEEVVNVTPDYIYVRPMPSLKLDYFLTKNVAGDNPFTPLVEPSVPFTLGVRIRNTGFGDAVGLKIESSQPRIVENAQGAPVGFRIQGCQVNGAEAAPTLLADVGTVPALGASTVRWQMTSILDGEFVSFEAYFTHSDLLGGEVTSLFTEDPVTHFLVHDVLVDIPGRDAIRDFLALDGDTLGVYESDAGSPDTEIPAGQWFGVRDDGDDHISLVADNGAHRLDMPSGATVSPGSFFYLKVSDPFGGERSVSRVVRSDGKVLPAANAWFSWKRVNSDLTYFFNIFDTYVGASSSAFSYQVETSDTAEGNRAPVLSPLIGRIVHPGESMGINVTATDPDGTTPAISVPIRPFGSTYTDNANGTGHFAWTPDASQLGEYSVQFTASDGLLTASKTVRIVVTDAPSKIEAWKEQYWPEVTDSSVVGNQADPDGDGFSNLYEYGLGMDPTKSSLLDKPQVTKEEINGKHYLVVTYTRRTDDALLTVDVIGSSDVRAPDDSSAWVVIGVGNFGEETTSRPADVPDGLERVRAVDGTALEDSPTGRYVRVRVRLGAAQ